MVLSKQHFVKYLNKIGFSNFSLFLYSVCVNMNRVSQSLSCGTSDILFFSNPFAQRLFRQLSSNCSFDIQMYLQFMQFMQFIEIINNLFNYLVND